MDSAGPGCLQVARVPRPAGAVAQVEPGADSLTADGTERLKLRINVQAVTRCLEAMLE